MNKEAVPLEEKKATQPAENEELETKEAPRQAEEETKKAEEAASKPEKKAKKEKSEKADKIGRAEALEKELDGVKRELEALKDQHQRMLAEYANYKRRTEQEKEQLGEFTKAETLRELLTSVDNLERAVAAPDGEEYKMGVDMTIRQFQETLHKLGLEEIEADGAPFNPEWHHAVMREDADGVEPDTVTEVFQKGYKVGNRILRPAMVKVAN